MTVICKDIPLPVDDECSKMKEYESVLIQLDIGDSVELPWDAGLYYYGRLYPKKFVNRIINNDTVRFWRKE